jgi:L-lactate dehydrogenase complex protein LldE
LKYVELPEAEQCCGFGGTFSIKNADVSAAMLADKMKTIAATGADVCAACDNSCLMHIYGGLHRKKQPIRVAHLAEILASEHS